jgi:hypothetical protein
MSRHLTAEEVVAALERDLAPSRMSHLDGCESCRAQLAAVRGLHADLQGAGEVPEPSPLFWDHFSARVRRATAEEPVPVVRWWQTRWLPLASGACAVGVLAVMLSVRAPSLSPESHVLTDSAANASGPDAAASPEEGRWDDVVQMAAQLSVEDVGDMVPTLETSNLVEALTSEEREAFARLLMAELKRSE